MNPETHFLVERPYLEVVDDILTALVGGVVNEAIEYDVKSDLYRLSEPARDVRGITGLLVVGEDLKETHHSFLKGIDFEFSEGDNAVVWVEGGDRPKDETSFYVDYFRQESRSPISDINVGSVARTLGEAVGREIATVYEQINQAYRSGFIDTAEGKSLDLVVSILGITRKTADFATGLVTFFRDPAVAGAIAIPQGLALQTAKGDAFFETTEPRVLQAGQVRIDAPVRAAVGFGGDKGIVPAGAITAMVQPLAGINRITNFDATTRAAANETDPELRARARAALRALGKATLAALDRVIREGRGIPVEFWDPNSPPAKRSDPGTVSVLVEAEPERLPSLQAAVQETRAAGVLATLVARYVFFRPRMVVKITSGLTAAGKDKVKAEIIAALQAYVDGLSSGDAAEGKKLLDAAKGVKDVSEVLFKDVITWKSDVGKPAAQVLTDTLIAAVAAVPAGSEGTAALQEAITRVLEEAEPTAPTGSRTPDRDLLKDAAADKRAGDTEIEKAEFKVAAEVGGEKWFVVLDMGPEDIVLTEAGGAN